MSSEDPNKFVDRLLEAGRGETPPPAGKSSALAAVERGDAPRAAPPKGTPWTAWAARAVGAAVIVGVAVFALTPKGSGETQAPQLATPQPPNTQPSNTQPSNTQPSNTQPVDPPVVAQPPPLDVTTSPPIAIAPGKTKRPARIDAGATDEDTLAKELELLEEARTLLASDPPKAVKTLDGYFKKFPAGSLKQEASLLKIEALVRAGRRSEAEVAAKHFLGAGSSPLLQERVRTILEAGK